MMRRGSSLQSRRSKTSGDPSKGSPQAQRRGTQDGLLHPVRPRSSSTDAHCSPAQAEGQLANSHVLGDDYDRQERYEGSGPAVSPSLAGSDGSAETGESSVDPQRTRQVVTQLQQKILKLTEQIKIEQTARDDNVAEYLKLAHGAADKQQGARIKQVFEKKNQKSAQSIQQLQKKLEHCHRKLREAEHNGIARQPKDVLRDVQQGLKDVGARVTHSVAAKPREIASLLRNRFGSADNIPGLEEGPGEEGPAVQPPPSPRYDSEDECSSATSGSAGANSTAAAAAAAAGPSAPGFGLETLLQELQDVRNGQSRLMEYLDELKTYYQRDYSFILQALQEERYRCERLEEQLNDLTELHQNEIFLLKQELASMEEKVAYQSYERGQDIQEALEACQTRISKMELQQQQQQVVQLEGLENATARTLLGKLINVLLAAMAVLLVFVSTLSSCVGPLMRTRTRSISTLLLLLLLAGLWKTWDAMGQLWDHVWHYSR